MSETRTDEDKLLGRAIHDHQYGSWFIHGQQIGGFGTQIKFNDGKKFTRVNFADGSERDHCTCSPGRLYPCCKHAKWLDSFGR